MTDEELNRAAAKALGWEVWNDQYWRKPGSRTVWRMASWSPATKIEHAWLVQEAAMKRDAVGYVIALIKLEPDKGLAWVHQWLATAPPRARVEAGLSVLGGQD